MDYFEVGWTVEILNFDIDTFICKATLVAANS